MRPLSLEDMSVVGRWFEQIDDLTVFDRRAVLPVSAAATQTAWREVLLAPEPRDSYWFAIDDGAGQIVGLAGLQAINYIHGDAILPIYISKPARRRGVGVRSAGILLDLGFHQLRLTRITSYYRADNAASRQLIEICGFREEGRIRKGWFTRGRHVDVVVVGILASEWRARRRGVQERMQADTVLCFGCEADRGWPWPDTAKQGAASDTKA